jgi:hypothetical protein
MGTRFLEFGLIAWFALLLLLMVVRILNGAIRVDGFLTTGVRTPLSGGDTSVNPERVVALGTIPIILGFYIFAALHTNVSVPKPSLPDIPPELLAVLTGINGLYLAGKISRRGKGGQA